MALIMLFKLLLTADLLLFPYLERGDIMVEKTQKKYLDLSKYSDLPLEAKNCQRIKPLAEKPLQKENKTAVNKKPVLAPIDLEQIFYQYSNEYGVNKEKLKQIAGCESNFNSKAVNGPYGGIYQYLASTWVSSRKQMGLDANPALRFNPEESIKTTAYKIAKDGTSAWPVCGR